MKEQYEYDTHIHTKEASACGHATGREHARTYKELGYDGIVITDHFFNGNCAVYYDMPWKEKVDAFCLGYEEAFDEGRKIGLKVFFGFEFNHHGTEFLIYGLDKSWLYAHPDCVDWAPKKLYEEVKSAGGMMIHAHPFREDSYIPAIRLFPEHVDGVEVFNVGNIPRGIGFNEKAYEYAKTLDLPMTSGTDSHDTSPVKAGMIFDESLKDIQDFMNKILAKDYELIKIDEKKG